MSTPSPCVRACCLGLDDICLGCGRHLSEITGWQSASEEEKQAIASRSAQRLANRIHSPNSKATP